MMQISVIIPVYKAERFVEKAVLSALQQEETYEVLLIEDASPDNSLKVCQELAKKYSRVRLLRHPQGVNRGAGATRNLGIENAKSEWVAFLDADDFFLPERFKAVKSILNDRQDIDGVYECVGMHFYDSLAKQKWLSRGGELLTCLDKPVHPDYLFETLINRDDGYIHLDGLVVKKKLFDLSGNFPVHLRLHQDTALILQLSAFGSLAPGQLKTPVALRGIHADNRITNNTKEAETRALLWDTMLSWSYEKNAELKKRFLIYKRKIEASHYLSKQKAEARYSKYDSIKFLCRAFIKHPLLFIGAAYVRLIDNRCMRRDEIS